MSSMPEPITLPDGTAVPEKWIGTYKGAIACEAAVCGWLKTPHDKVGRWIALSTPDDNLISLISDLAHAEAANQELRETGQALLAANNKFEERGDDKMNDLVKLPEQNWEQEAISLIATETGYNKSTLTAIVEEYRLGSKRWNVQDAVVTIAVRECAARLEAESRVAADCL